MTHTVDETTGEVDATTGSSGPPTSTPTNVPDEGDGGPTRRHVLQGAAFLGATAVVVGGGAQLGRSFRPFPDYLSSDVAYALAEPENIIYTTCLQCQIRCALKVKSHDGVAVKIDGNGYSAKHVLPNIPYDTPLGVAATVDGKLCPKGIAGIQTYADPYRVRKVLKRVGPRGSGKWKAVPFEEAVRDVVDGGDLFGEGHVAGLRDVCAVRDAAKSKELATDVDAMKKGSMKVDEFKAKHASALGDLIDPDHPDLGPKNNQFAFVPGRINRSRSHFAKRFVTGGLGSVAVYPHTSICELSIFTCTAEMTRDVAKGKGKNHFAPDYANSEFIIFWGTGFAEANFGVTPMAELVTKNLTEGRLKVAVIDPRMSKSAAKAWKWVPVRPGGDAALAMGMLRRIIDEKKYDAKYLENPNVDAAKADGEKNSSDATHLVRTDKMAMLRAKDIGIEVPPPPEDPKADKPDFFVVMTADGPKRHDQADAGQLEVDTTVNGIPVKSVFTLLAERAREKSIDEYAALAGISASTIVELADEFTAHGKKSAIDIYRGPAKHPDGFHAVQAINTLNILIGNQDWKGGLADGGGTREDIEGHVYDLAKLHPGKLTGFGVPLSREGWAYEQTSLHASDGYPAKRPWQPFAAEANYHDLIPSAEAGYPYPVKILWLHMGTPGYAVPGIADQIRIVRDPKIIPLFIATDIVVGETSMYADYIFPDTSYLEQWASPGDVLQPATKSNPIRQPAAAPVPEEVTVYGERMPLSMETVMLAIAERMGVPGFGPDGFDKGVPLTRQEDYYLKIVANLAFGTDKDGKDSVPDADAAELEVFRSARRHLPKSVYDEEKWKRAAGPTWPKAVYVLNRGGRFESFTKAYDGKYMGHAWGGTWHIFLERVAARKDSITGKPFDGLPRYAPPVFADGKEIDDAGYQYLLITYKEVFASQSRTPGTYWSQSSLRPENFVLMNKADGERAGLHDDDLVRLSSPSLTNGEVDLGPAGKLAIEGHVKLIEGIRPGVVAISHHFGHWAYGARDVEVDGAVMQGDPRRGKGIPVNALFRLDEFTKTGAPTDPIGGSVSFFDTRINVAKI